jgi:hypothetical protein
LLAEEPGDLGVDVLSGEARSELGLAVDVDDRGLVHPREQEGRLDGLDLAGALAQVDILQLNLAGIAALELGAQIGRLLGYGRALGATACGVGEGVSADGAPDDVENLDEYLVD